VDLIFGIATWRDWVIVIAGVLAAILLLIMIVFTVVIGVATRTLIGAVRNLIDTEVTPAARRARETAIQVKGTVQFVSETTVTPIARTYGAVAGVRRVIVVMSGFSRRNRQPKEDQPLEGGR
jgi:hypothetical protein